MDNNIKDIPNIQNKLIAKSEEIGFTMPSDLYIGTLLKTLISSKPNGNFLELGTGISLSLSWMIDGMSADSRITTIDNDPKLTAIAKEYFENDNRVKIICEDAAQWIKKYHGKCFDLIFADAWPGKYSEIDEVLNLIKIGGFYVIDDMLTQPNWPEGHEDNVGKLISFLEKRKDFNITKMNWSTGVIIAVKINNN
jgi:predicted O-methyltransferase YrrM